MSAKAYKVIATYTDGKTRTIGRGLTYQEAEQLVADTEAMSSEVECRITED